MRTIEVKVYEFDELSEEVKERAIETVRKIWYDIHIQDEVDFLVGWAIEQLREKAGVEAEEKDITFGTGRGAYAGLFSEAFVEAVMYRFGDEVRDISILPKKIGVWFSDFPSWGWEQTEADAIDCIEFYDDVSEDRQKEIRGKIEDMLYSVVEVMRELMDALEEAEYRLYSNEYWEDYIKANELEFYEDGSLA